jgi:hypothetical protein
VAVLQGKLDAITGGPKLFVDVAFLVVNIMGNTIFRADAHAQSRLFWAEQKDIRVLTHLYMNERDRETKRQREINRCWYLQAHSII